MCVVAKWIALYREMRELFPDCEILREKFLGFTKSYVAVRQFKV